MSLKTMGSGYKPKTMPRRLTLSPHLSPQELESYYRKATDPIERTHYQILWLLAKGKTSGQIAEVTGYSLFWIRRLVKRYNQEGPKGMGDRRRDNPGAMPLLNPELKAQLLQTLQQTPPDGGKWNGVKVAQWMSEHLNQPVLPQRGWEYFKTLTAELSRSQQP
jgi:transposase